MKQMPHFGLPQFSTRTVCAVAGIDPPTLATWRKRKLLEPLEDDLYEGHSKYSLVDLLQVVALAKLTQLGITPGKGSFIVSDLAGAIEEEIIPGPGESPDTYFLAQRQSEAFYTCTDFNPLKALSNSGAGIVINITAVWKKIEKDLKELGEGLE